MPRNMWYWRRARGRRCWGVVWEFGCRFSRPKAIASPFRARPIARRSHYTWPKEKSASHPWGISCALRGRLSWPVLTYRSTCAGPCHLPGSASIPALRRGIRRLRTWRHRDLARAAPPYPGHFADHQRPPKADEPDDRNRPRHDGRLHGADHREAGRPVDYRPSAGTRSICPRRGSVCLTA